MKKRFLSIAGLLLACSLWGQQSAPVPSHAIEHPSTVPDDDDSRPLSPSASGVAPDAAVITVKGFCASPSASAGEKSPTMCQTLISRAQFEKLADAMLPNRQPSKQRQLAASYPNLLAMAQAAETRGLEKNQRVQQRLAFARLQILSQELLHQIDEDSANIPKTEIEDYYRNHPSDFETATVERIFIPNRKRPSPSPDDKAVPNAAQPHKSDAEISQLAESLRAKAIAGESFLKLEQEAYTSEGLTDVPPNPSLGQLLRSGLPPGHAFAFDLKPGEVSPVFSDATGFYIYKVISKQVEDQGKAEAQIRRMLKRERKEKAIQAIQQHLETELNPAYFGPTEKSEDASEPK